MQKPMREYFVNGDEDRWYPVDVHLEDEWLNKLNSLKVFELRSICEGHVNENPAFILLKVKKELYGIASSGMDVLSMYLDFPNTVFEIKHLNVGDTLRKEIWLRAEFFRDPKNSANFEEYTRHLAWPKCATWFEEIIDKINEMDLTLAKVIGVEN